MNLNLAKHYLIQNIKMSQTLLSALHWTFNGVFIEINIRQKWGSLKDYRIDVSRDKQIFPLKTGDTDSVFHNLF